MWFEFFCLFVFEIIFLSYCGFFERFFFVVIGFWFKCKVEDFDMSMNEWLVFFLKCGEIFLEYILRMSMRYWVLGLRMISVYVLIIILVCVWLIDLLVMLYWILFFRGFLFNYCLFLKKRVFFCLNWLFFKIILFRSSVWLWYWFF